MTTPGVRRVLRGGVGGFVAVTGVAWLMLSATWPDLRAVIHVRWRPEVTDEQRLQLEHRFLLTDAEHTEGATWRYRLEDASGANIRAIVEDAHVDDTANVHRGRFRPAFAMDRSRQVRVYSVAIGAMFSVVLLATNAVRAFSPKHPSTPVRSR